MRKFLVTTFVTAFIVSSASFAFAQKVAGTPGIPEFSGDIVSNVDVFDTKNDVSGTGSESEIHAGSIASGIMVGDFTTTVKVVTGLDNSSLGDGNEANITLGSIGE